MIILIAGDTHTGKTNLAQKLLEHYKIPYVSIDHLKMGLIRSGNTGLTPESDDDTLTEKLWPVVREMIKLVSKTTRALLSKAVISHGTGKKISQKKKENQLVIFV